MSCPDLWLNSCHDAGEKLIFRDGDRNLIIWNTYNSVEKPVYSKQNTSKYE